MRSVCAIAESHAVHKVKRMLQALAATVLICHALWAQTPDATLDHFAPNEDVSASFAWERGAQCTLSDRIGVVLRSNWQERHWIKIGGKQAHECHSAA